MLSLGSIVGIVVGITVGLLLFVLVAQVMLQVHAFRTEIKRWPSSSASEFNFQNGDLLLFAPHARLGSFMHVVDTLHMLMSNCAVTHIAMVVQDPYTGMLRCWELGLFGGIPDMLRLSSLQARLVMNQGHVLVRRLRRKNFISARCMSPEPPCPKKTYRVIDQIFEEHRKRGTRYRSSFYLNTYDTRWSSVPMYLHPPLPLAPESSCHELMCTDVVSRMYHALGVFDRTDDSLWPGDFYSRTQRLPLNAQWYFEPEVRVS